jgi:hypothetical protein
MRFAVRFGLQHPILALELAFKRITLEQAFARVLRTKLPRLPARYGEARSRGETALGLGPERLQRTAVQIAGGYPQPASMTLTPWHAFLYLAVRELRPKFVVETGVWYGWSSAAILQGLHDNGSGKLVSIDLPPTEHRERWERGHEVQVGLLEGSHSVGSSVPPELRDRWELRLGNSLEVLPAVLKELGTISVFVHDSLHTYEHMMGEYGLAFGALEDGGMLASDDIGMNSAWDEFCGAHGVAGVRLSKGRDGKAPFGFALKTGRGPTRAMAPAP